jgi:hypothetical protein
LTVFSPGDITVSVALHQVNEMKRSEQRVSLIKLTILATENLGSFWCISNPKKVKLLLINLIVKAI